MKNRISIVTVLIILLSGTSLLAVPTLREMCAELVAANDGKSAIAGVDGWLFLKDELVHMSAGKFWGEDAAKVSRAKKKEFADPLPAIINYNKALADRGITLYLMPVPPKGLVYPGKLVEGVVSGDAQTERELYTEFYSELRQNGVNVIDLLPQLVEKADKENVYCKTDTHFSGVGLQLFAQEAAKLIKAEAWYETIPKKTFTFKEQEMVISGDLTQMLGGTEKENILLSMVRGNDTGAQVASDIKSPVILMGDSHTLVFSAGGDLHAKGSGLFDNLSAELGFPLDLLGVRGSGVTPARIKLFQRSKKDPDYLTGKKVLIWCFTAREFTGTGGWREIPVDAKK
jgi:alginate O-acetyltransferase complex protein AlgJ